MMIRRFALVMLVLSACGESYDQIITEPEDRQCPPLLPARIDFGEVEQTFPGQQTLNLFNPNQRIGLVVSITRLTPPFFLEQTNFRLEPRQTVPARLIFLPPDPRQHFGALTYNRSDGCEPQEVELAGIGAGSLEAEERTLDFGPVPLDVKATKVLRLNNTRRSDVVVEMRPSASIEVARRVTVPARSSLDVPVSVTPRAGQGIMGSIQAVSDAVGAGGIDSFIVTVIGSAGRPHITVDRTDFVVERVPLDGWLMRRVWITNSGDGPSRLNLSVLHDPDAGTSVLSGASISNLGSLAPDSGVTAFLHVRADRAGFGRQRAVLENDDPANPRITLTVEGTGVMVGACGPNAVSVTPSSVDWQPPMFPAQQTFTFSNANAEDCLLDAIETTQWPLAPGETDQALVPAGGTVTRTIDLSAPGNGFLLWNTYVPPFIQNGQAPISIRP